MKKTASDPYAEFRKALTAEENGQLDEYLRELRTHIQLNRKETARMLRDFIDALMYYRTSGASLAQALSLLDTSRLGGFYSRPPIVWYPLDDAAKIYPLSMSSGQMAVFRLSVYLKEPVVPQLLQIALAFTIKRFPGFATTVKKGFFWHYLDATKRRYVVHEDRDVPCRPINVAQSRSQSFRVLYFGNRVSVEYFHILTDGTGGTCFIKALVCEYLRLTGVKIPKSDLVYDIESLPTVEETQNAFPTVEKEGKTSGFLNKIAVQLSGKMSRAKPYRILHFNMNSDELRNVAKKRGATVTAYLLAQMFLAGKFATDETEGSQCVSVPVNMRKYYPINTLRNFSMYCSIRLNISEITSFDDILPKLSDQLHEKASREAMSEMMRSTHELVSMVRYVPLTLKQPVARMVYGYLGEQCVTNTLSNLGIIKAPPEMEEHIDHMDFVLGTTSINRASCALVTFKNTATLTVSQYTYDPTFEDKLYELLCLDSLNPRVEGSEPYED